MIVFTTKLAIVGILAALLLGCIQLPEYVDAMDVPHGHVAIRANDEEDREPLLFVDSRDHEEENLRCIELLNEEIEQRLPLSRWLVLSSYGNPAAMAFEWPRDGSVDGVYVWRDWRNAHQWELWTDATSGAFLSRELVWLQDANGSQSYIRSLVTNKTVPVDQRIIDLQLAEDDRWLGLTDGFIVMSGMLDAEISLKGAKTVAGTKREVFAAWPHGFVGVERGDEVVVYDKDGNEVDSVSGSIYWPYPQGDYIILKTEGVPTYYTCNDDGLAAAGHPLLAPLISPASSSSDHSFRGIRWPPGSELSGRITYLAVLPGCGATDR